MKKVVLHEFPEEWKRLLINARFKSKGVRSKPKNRSKQWQIKNHQKK